MFSSIASFIAIVDVKCDHELNVRLYKQQLLLKNLFSFINQLNKKQNAMESSRWLHSKRLLSRTNSKHLFRLWSIRSTKRKTAHIMQFFESAHWFRHNLHFHAIWKKKKQNILRKHRASKVCLHIINHRDAQEFSQVLDVRVVFFIMQIYVHSN